MSLSSRSTRIQPSNRAFPNRRARRREETRERIYRAALGLFAERGYLETTVEDITEAADVGKGTFFNYFPTKEHVLAAFGAERVAAIERGSKKAFARTHRPILPVIRELATHFAEQANESPALLRAIYAAHVSCAPVRAELQKRIRRARELMAEIFKLAQQRGEVRQDVSAAELARLTQLIFMGVTLAWAMNPEKELQKTGEDVWEILVPSLQAERSAVRNRK